MGGPEWAMLAASALPWASSYLFFKVPISALPPFTVVFGWVTVASAVLNLVILLRGGRLPGDRRIWLAFAVLGAALSCGCAGVFGRRFRALPPLAVA